MTQFIHLSQVPGSATVLWKAFGTLFKKPGHRLPDIGYTLDLQGVDERQFAQFCTLFGFDTDKVPLTYWHIRLFGVRALLAAHADFPFPMPGMVHLSDEIIQHETIYPNDKLMVECMLGRMLSHEKGTAFETLTKLYRNGILVWEETTVNLYLGKTLEHESAFEAVQVDIENLDKEAIWLLPSNLGWQYAKISGDFNPIHINKLGARIFGFKQQIMHGWYSVNRSLAPYKEKITGAARLETSFKKPLFLPAKIRSCIQSGPDLVDFVVEDFQEKWPHVKGRLSIPRKIG